HVAYLRFSPDGNVLASANHQGTIRLWRAATDTEAVARQGQTAPSPTGVALRPGTTTDIETTLRSAVEINAKDVQAHRTLGDVLLFQEKWSEAIARYQKAIELDPNYTNSYTGLERAFISLGNARRGQG